MLASSLVASAVPRPAAAAGPPLEIVEARDAVPQAKGKSPERPSTAGVRPRGLRMAPVPFGGQGYASDVEPNNSAAIATPLAGTSLVVRGDLFPNGDVDFYSFAATAGDRVYAATMTSFSAGSSTDSQLTLLASDGTTVLEFDDDNGTFAALSSSIAGAVVPATGTYYLKVNDFTAGTTSERPYEMHLRIQGGAPTAEVEPNDSPAAATPLPASGGWVSGVHDPVAEQDWYSLTLAAGDTVYLALDLDPERDGVVWNGRVGLGLFGDTGNLVTVVDDAGNGDVSPHPNIPSEALFVTVKGAGTYYVLVDAASATVGGPTATYHLSASVHPAVDEGVACTTYTSTDVPKAIGPDPGIVSSTITVPGSPRVADLDVSIVLDHARMADIDAHLRSPGGTDIGIFSDIGATSTGGQAQMDLTFDDEAGIPPGFAVTKGFVSKPELAYRLGWFDGESAGGTWTLDLRDDTAASGGTLASWSIRVCEPPPPPACPTGFAAQTVFSTDFEGGASGFTHSGTADEWELGLPATAATTTANPVAAFTTCNSGTTCWKTDLDGTYDASSSQNLLSPPIDLSGLAAPVVVTWAQRFQMESASFDHLFVDAQQAGGATPVRLFEWRDGTMTDAPGNPVSYVAGSSGWALLSRRADSLAGLASELRFHVDGDSTINFGGLAVDDVTVTACRALSADLAVTKTDGVTTAAPGGSVTYTVTATNAGPDGVTGATVADTFPAPLTCSWTCVGAGCGACTASGSGNLADTVDLPAGASVTYTAACTIAPGATGSLANTATVTSAVVADPVPGNNVATDTDTLVPQADLAITKTDGQPTVLAGGPLTYTIVAANAGPSHAPEATVADALPAAITGAVWTCVGTGGGTCTASGAGDIADTVSLPAGGSVIYTVTGTVVAGTTGALSNTATVAAPAGVTDPAPGNNSATDTDAVLGLAYYTVTPCRVVDTRGGTAPIGGPVMTARETRTLALAGHCGVPAGAKAVQLNIAVTQPTAAGHIRLFPAGQPLPTISTINYSAGETRGNNAVISLNGAGAADAFVNQPVGTTVHVVIDVSGYFE